MEKSEMIWIASVAIGKNLDYETLYYSDYMYGKESFTDEVYEYVTECRKIGQLAFREKYKEYKLY
jgi:hypothetical protein